MRKIPTIFKRNPSDMKHVMNELTPGCEWVLAGEGVATRKYDGTCCLVRDGKLYKRHEVKKGKTAPPEFEPANEVDPNTGKQAGWLPVGDGPEDKHHREAWKNYLSALESEGVTITENTAPGDGTYELVGPKIQGNPEKYESHQLIAHSLAEQFTDVPRDFEGLRAWLTAHEYEGIVWHWRQPDGSILMGKIKKRDFA